MFVMYYMVYLTLLRLCVISDLQLAFEVDNSNDSNQPLDMKGKPIPGKQVSFGTKYCAYVYTSFVYRNEVMVLNTDICQ